MPTFFRSFSKASRAGLPSPRSKLSIPLRIASTASARSWCEESLLESLGLTLLLIGSPSGAACIYEYLLATINNTSDSFLIEKAQ
jgi:hypothetical protein